MEFVAATGGTVDRRICPSPSNDCWTNLPRDRCSLDELTERLHAGYWPLVPLDALERRHLVVKSSLTPTDVVHAAGRLDLWNAEAAKRLCRLFCRLLGVSLEEFTRMVHQQIVRRLATELLRKQLGERAEADKWDRSSAAAAMVGNWLDGGTDDYHVHVALRYPIIGIGAPIHLYLPDAAQLLETQAVIPPHADVANAIGAITGRVSIHRQVEIEPTEQGRYTSERFAQHSLVRRLRGGPPPRPRSTATAGAAASGRSWYEQHARGGPGPRPRGPLGLWRTDLHRQDSHRSAYRTPRHRAADAT